MRQLINIGSIWPSYPNSSVNVKYFLGCIVSISNGSLNLIWFILAHVICTVVTHACPCLYDLVGEIKFIYLFILMNHSPEEWGNRYEQVSQIAGLMSRIIPRLTIYRSRPQSHVSLCIGPVLRATSHYV